MLSLLVVFYLRRPLFSILTELCGTDERAYFWSQITKLSFILTAMLMSFSYRPKGYIPNYYFLAGHLSRTLLGLLLVVLILAMTFSRFIRRQEKATLQARQTNENAK
jgi:hypothetical protein